MQKVVAGRRASAAFESALEDSAAYQRPAAKNGGNGGAARTDVQGTQAKYMAKVAEQELLETLRTVDLFSHMSEEQLNILMKNLQKSEYKKKQFIFKQGDGGDRFYIITSGTASVIRTSGNLHETIQELQEGSFFGERSLLLNAPRYASIRVTSTVLRTLSIDKAAFEEHLGKLDAVITGKQYTPTAPPPPRPKLRRNSTVSALTGGMVYATPVMTIRRHKKLPVGERQAPKPLIEGGRPGRHSSFEDVVKADMERKALLSLARDISPIDSIARLSALPRTVIPRILSHYLTWLVVLIYIVASVICRIGVDFGDLDLTAFDSSNTLITFMIIFYVGYCYNRYTAQFADVEHIMHAIIDACVLARVTFRDSDEVLRLWRYLSLLHLSAYTGLTSSYTEANFFAPMCKRHGLGPKTDAERAAEAPALEALHNGDGAAAVHAYQIWSYEILQTEAQRPNARITPPVHARMNHEIMEVGKAAKRLHAYTYQVLPFIYTHLVSLMCTLYLLFNAFIKGLYFAPEASLTFGLLLPLCSMLTTTLAVFGLLEVGDTILDPFGSDPEDFTVLHFVEWTMSSSLAAIELDPVLPPTRDRPAGQARAEDCYTREETMAMVRIIARMVARFRARKAAKDQIMQLSMQSAIEAESFKRRPIKPRGGALRGAPSRDASIQSVDSSKIIDPSTGDHHGRQGPGVYTPSSAAPPSSSSSSLGPTFAASRQEGTAADSERREERQEAGADCIAQKERAPTRRPKRTKQRLPPASGPSTPNVGATTTTGAGLSTPDPPAQAPLPSFSC